METTIAYWDYIGIMEKEMETTFLLGLCTYIEFRVLGMQG